MRFFAQSFNNSPWQAQAGLILAACLPMLIMLSIFGGLLYGAYWLGTQH